MASRGIQILSGAGLALGLLGASYPLFWRDWCLTWGATADEVASNLQGDELLPEAHLATTKAIAIDAPPDRVWPWLVQMGSGRAGTYTYDWIDNLFGLDMHSANVILPQFQDVQVGDAYPFGSGTLHVEALEPGRVLVTRVPEWNWVRIFYLIPDGGLTRLLLRNRVAYPGTGFASRLCRQMISEAAGLPMERKMLRGIKRRAETEDVWPDWWGGQFGGASLSSGPALPVSPGSLRAPPWDCRSRTRGLAPGQDLRPLAAAGTRSAGTRSRSPRRSQVIAQADVVGEQYLRAEAGPHEIKDVVDRPARVVRRPGADGVERDVTALLDQGQVVFGNRNAIDVPDDNPPRVDALLGEQPELRKPDWPPGRMRADRQTGPAVSPGCGTERPLLSGGDVPAVGADLADDAGPDPGAADPSVISRTIWSAIASTAVRSNQPRSRYGSR